METTIPTEDSCQLCSAACAPLALMIAMPVYNPRADFILYPACEFCYTLVMGSEIRSPRVVPFWPPPSGFDHKVWSRSEYDATYFPEPLAQKEQAPARVQDIEDFWVDEPPERSERCAWWVARIADGWRPNRRLRAFGYHEASEYYGVWIWEYINVIVPALRSPT